MSNSIYTINKGINQSIEFKGLKAQYIWYLGGIIICLLIVFAALYIIGIPSLVCIGIIMVSGTVSVMKVYRISNKYGQYGMMKAIASRSVPKIIRCNSRSVFINYKNNLEDEK